MIHLSRKCLLTKFQFFEKENSKKYHNDKQLSQLSQIGNIHICLVAYLHHPKNEGLNEQNKCITIKNQIFMQNIFFNILILMHKKISKRLYVEYKKQFSTSQDTILQFTYSKQKMSSTENYSMPSLSLLISPLSIQQFFIYLRISQIFDRKHLRQFS